MNSVAKIWQPPAGVGLLVLIASLVAGCKVGPDYRSPDISYIPPTWSDSAHPRLNGEPIDPAIWWTAFQDPTLNQLVEQALAENFSLKEAGQRILQARHLRNVVAGNLFPQQQTANAGFSVSRLSENSANFFSFPGVFAPDLLPDSWSAGVAASWELDFWGQYRRAIESADAQVEVAAAAYDQAQVLLLGELASAYIELRTSEARIELALANVAIQEKSLALAEQKLAAGTTTELDVHQARGNLAQTNAILPLLDITRRQAAHRICVLIGQPAFDIEQVLGWTGKIPNPPAALAASVPMDLLRRRPDVRLVERELAAQSARIGIAQADLYPRLSLVGAIGLEAENLNQLFQSSSLTGLAGPQVSWKILNYGRIKNKIAAERAAFEATCHQFHQAVLEAYQEAQDAQVAFFRGYERVDSLGQAVQHSSAAARIAQEAFDNGATDFNRVYLLQSDLVRQQDALTVSQGDIAKSLVGFYVAMGGGWVAPCPPTAGDVVTVDCGPLPVGYDGVNFQTNSAPTPMPGSFGQFSPNYSGPHTAQLPPTFPIPTANPPVPTVGRTQGFLDADWQFETIGRPLYR